MSLPVNPALAATLAPPVMEARRWLSEIALPEGMALLNLSQAAPVEPPVKGMRRALAAAIEADPSVHLYGAVFGNTPLREALAGRMRAIYGGEIRAENVALTAGCNQAFCTVIQGLAQAGDAVILPVPWYFNHHMWLQMNGIETIPLQTGEDLLPDPEACARLITDKVKAIALVSPNNPGGVEYPPELIAAFLKLAREKGIALILDETYRDFHTRDGAPHDLFTDPDWDDALIHLYSFSKAYRLTGHRLGAIVAAPSFLAQIEKVLDTVTICPAGPGQVAGLWGLENLTDWLAGERREILARRAAMIEGFKSLEGWELRGCGAYFAYARHPFDLSARDAARHVLGKAGALMLPGTMFRPKGDPAGEREIRIAFANANVEQIGELMTRLGALR